MIDRREILERSGELSLRPDVVEKDYLLGWLLAGIAQHEEIGSSWVFKGGTCLKKVYFETYRFSEDLDFTLTENAHLDEGFLRRVFGEIAAWIYEQSGIEIPADRLRFDLYRNDRNALCAEGRIYYRGPLQPGGNLPRVKLDLTADEVVVLEPATQRVSHTYGDEPPQGIWVPCYPFVEVFAEKIRALVQRCRPRDLYDVINLFRRNEARGVIGSIRDVLARKCQFKGIAIPSFDAVRSYRTEIEADWGAMLGHQLPALPPFETFWGELPAFFAWLSERREIPEPPQYALTRGEEVMRIAAGGLRAAGLVAARPLETIRFAAANHLCVDLDYRDEEGRRSTRRIEAYSLRRTGDGNVVLHAERADGRGHRSYRIDRILDARVAEQTFSPRFRVELTPIGPQAIPPVPSRGRENRVSAPRGWPQTGPRYVYQCTLCGKQFTRKREDARLGPHKDMSGYPCAGRAGFFVNVRY
jgi:predicted nucleotidyltransferase component of viral defense system